MGGFNDIHEHCDRLSEKEGVYRSSGWSLLVRMLARVWGARLVRGRGNSREVVEG